MRARFGDFFDRIFNGGGFFIDGIAPVLQPVMDVDRLDNSHRWSLRNRPHSASIIVAPVAAELSLVQLANPAQSGVVALVQRMRYSSSAAAASTISIGLGYTAAPLALPAAGGIQSRDTRQGTTARASACSLTGDSVAVGFLPSVWDMVTTAVSDPLDLFDPEGLFILAPGGVVQMFSGNPNVTGVGAMMWLERPLPDLEQQP